LTLPPSVLSWTRRVRGQLCVYGAEQWRGRSLALLYSSFSPFIGCRLSAAFLLSGGWMPSSAASVLSAWVADLRLLLCPHLSGWLWVCVVRHIFSLGRSRAAFLLRASSSAAPSPHPRWPAQAAAPATSLTVSGFSLSVRNATLTCRTAFPACKPSSLEPVVSASPVGTSQKLARQPCSIIGFRCRGKKRRASCRQSHPFNRLHAERGRRLSSPLPQSSTGTPARPLERSSTRSAARSPWAAMPPSPRSARPHQGGAGRMGMKNPPCRPRARASRPTARTAILAVKLVPSYRSPLARSSSPIFTWRSGYLCGFLPVLLSKHSVVIPFIMRSVAYMKSQGVASFHGSSMPCARRSSPASSSIPARLFRTSWDPTASIRRQPRQKSPRRGRTALLSFFFFFCLH